MVLAQPKGWVPHIFTLRLTAVEAVRALRIASIPQVIIPFHEQFHAIFPQPQVGFSVRA